jgi:hypothetical protein
VWRGLGIVRLEGPNAARSNGGGSFEEGPLGIEAIGHYAHGLSWAGITSIRCRRGFRPGEFPS